MIEISLAIVLGIFGAAVTLLLEHYQEWIYWVVSAACLIYMLVIYPRLRNPLKDFQNFIDKRLEVGRSIYGNYSPQDHAYWHKINYLVLEKTIGIEFLVILGFDILCQLGVRAFHQSGLNDELIELNRLKSRIKRSHLLKDFDVSIFQEHELH